MWEPQPLRTIWASTACYKYSFLIQIHWTAVLITFNNLVMLISYQSHRNSTVIVIFINSPFCWSSIKLIFHRNLSFSVLRLLFIMSVIKILGKILGRDNFKRTLKLCPLQYHSHTHGTVEEHGNNLSEWGNTYELY
jgi:hypothetical protein